MIVRDSECDIFRVLSLGAVKRTCICFWAWYECVVSMLAILLISSLAAQSVTGYMALGDSGYGDPKCGPSAGGV